MLTQVLKMVDVLRTTSFFPPRFMHYCGALASRLDPFLPQKRERSGAWTVTVRSAASMALVFGVRKAFGGAEKGARRTEQFRSKLMRSKWPSRGGLSATGFGKFFNVRGDVLFSRIHEPNLNIYLVGRIRLSSPCELCHVKSSDSSAHHVP